MECTTKGVAQVLRQTLRNLIVFGVFSFILTSTVYAADAPIKNGEEPIAPGVMHESYHWNTSYGNILFEVLKCDLSEPNLDLRLVAGKGKYTQKATVPAMAQRTDAVAMINGDFFNMALEGAPIGPSMINGQLASSPAVIKGIYSLGISADNTACIEALAYNGLLTASDGATFPIDGLNKTYYWHDPSGAESHTNLIQMYNDLWGSSSRGHATNSEVLINEQGIIEKISYGKTFPFPVPDHKIILQVNGKAEQFVKQHCPTGSKVEIISNVTPDKNWKFLVGGHALLTDKGKVVPYTKDLGALAGIRARTAAGISHDGKTLWFVCAEGRTNRSAGAHLSTLGYFMQHIGAYRSLNLDGGGSTNMVLKHYGETNLSTIVAPEGNGWLRPVVNGIGIYNSAPISDIAAFTVSGPTEMVVGETINLTVNKAVDKYYHPLQISQNEFTLSSYQEIGGTSGLYYVGLQPGTDTIQVTHKSGASKQHTIRVLGEEGLKKLYLKSDQFMVDNGSVVRTTLHGMKQNGKDVILDPRVAQWHLEGFTGDINAGTIAIINTEGMTNGRVTANIGTLSAEVLLGNNAFNLLDLYLNDTIYWLNGNSYSLDQPPIAKNNRTLVPIRIVTEALGGQVEWHSNEQSITIQYNNHQIELKLNSTNVIVDGEQTVIDVPPQVVKNRTLVPIRFISEAFDMIVDYDSNTQCISICGLK